MAGEIELERIPGINARPCRSEASHEGEDYRTRRALSSPAGAGSHGLDSAVRSYSRAAVEIRPPSRFVISRVDSLVASPNPAILQNMEVRTGFRRVAGNAN